MSQGGWFVPFEYVLTLVGAFVAILAALWLGVVVKVFVFQESRIASLEEYKANEGIRTQLLMAQFQVMLKESETRISQNFTHTLDTRRQSIETTIAQKVDEVVETIKNGGT